MRCQTYQKKKSVAFVSMSDGTDWACYALFSIAAIHGTDAFNMFMTIKRMPGELPQLVIDKG